MLRPKPIICSRKEFLHYVYDLETYVDQLEVEISNFNAKRTESNLEVQKMVKSIELLKNKLINNKQ